jgi:hypothetical protein
MMDSEGHVPRGAFEILGKRYNVHSTTISRLYQRGKADRTRSSELVLSQKKNSGRSIKYNISEIQQRLKKIIRPPTMDG